MFAAFYNPTNLNPTKVTWRLYLKILRLEKFARIMAKSSKTIVHETKTSQESEESMSIAQKTTIQRLKDHLPFLSKAKKDEYVMFSEADDFDLEKVLTEHCEEADAQGIKRRNFGVCFEDLTVLGKNQSYAFKTTMTDILMFPYLIYRSRRERKAPPRRILDEFDGLVESGEMLLVLGRPGSGCSTLLKNLSGTHLGAYLGKEGTIEYDGIPQKDILKGFRSELIYNPELDVHFPHLKVKQVLDFAIACKTPKTRVNDISRKQYVDFNRELFATIFGIRHTYRTKVGDDYVRGISGGERKRLLIAEAMACRGSVYCYDNATRGLDASTALEFAHSIRTSTNVLKKTTVAALYQAGANVYELFDKVTVLYEGKQVYFGSTLNAKQYFEEMGFECPKRQTTAEFLISVTDINDRIARPEMKRKVPKTAAEFQAYWKASPEYRLLKAEIEAYRQKFTAEGTKAMIDESLRQEKQLFQRARSKYTLNFACQLHVCIKRSYQIAMGNSTYLIMQVVAAALQGLVTGALFWKTPSSVQGAFAKSGVVYFVTFYMALVGLSGSTLLNQARPMLLKERTYCLYHPSAYFIADAASMIPLSVMVSFAFTVVVYFISGLDARASLFFIFLLFAFMISLVLGFLFKAVAAWNSTIAGTNAMAGILVLCSTMYSSYIIQPPSMHPWFKWIAKINPVLYAYEAMITSQFHNIDFTCDYNHQVPRGPGYNASNAVCAFDGSRKGSLIVTGDDYLQKAFQYSYGHLWRNFLILIGFLFLFLLIGCVGLELTDSAFQSVDRLSFIRKSKKRASQHPNIEMDEELGSSSGTMTTSDYIVKSSDVSTTKTLVWKDLNYMISYKNSQRQLLDSVCGFCLPGNLTALVGESGAGKTTLLNVLSQRTDIGVVSGDISIDGCLLDKTFVRRTGYVQQQDIHSSLSTVREALCFAARMRRPQSVPDAEKIQYVETVLQILDMEDYADAMIGKPGSGLSLEQRKKLTIGVELVAKPSLLLFLDEPTSGLDSQSAMAIIQLIRTLADAGQAILCTIHQPSATLFEVFDKALILKKGGQTVYFGDIGAGSQTITSYFQRKSGVECSDTENPAEYILNVIGAGATAKCDIDWFSCWQSSPEKTQLDIQINEIISREKDHLSATDVGDLDTKYAIGAWFDFKQLMVRGAIELWRNPRYIMAKCQLMLCNGLFVGFSFYNLKHSLAGIQNSRFAAFLSVAFSSPLINQVISQCFVTKEVYEGRERRSNTYRYWTMIFALLLNEIPYTFIACCVFFVCYYFPTKASLVPAKAGIFFLTFLVFLELFNITFGLVFAYSSPDLQTATVLNSFFFTIMAMFSGGLQPRQMMPHVLRFINTVSPYTYILENLFVSFVRGIVIYCDPDEFAIIDPPNGQQCDAYFANFIQNYNGYLQNPTALSNCRFCLYRSGDVYLKYMGTSISNIGRNFGFISVYIVFNLVFSVILYKVTRLTSWKRVFASWKMKFRRNKQ